MEKMREFYRAHKHCIIRQRVNTNETALYHWLSRVRKRNATLSPESRVELAEMGCNLDDSDGRTGCEIDRIAMMERFKKEHGHGKVKMSDCGYGSGYIGLYTWLGRVRRGEASISADDRKALETLGCDLERKPSKPRGGKRKRPFEIF